MAEVENTAVAVAVNQTLGGYRILYERPLPAAEYEIYSHALEKIRLAAGYMMREPGDDSVL